MQVTDLKSSRQSFKQWKAKQITPCTRYFSRALSVLQVIAENCDWLIALFAPVMIGWSNYFCFGFSTVIWKTFLKKQITKLLSLQSKRSQNSQHPDVIKRAWKTNELGNSRVSSLLLYSNINAVDNQICGVHWIKFTGNYAFNSVEISLATSLNARHSRFWNQ